jgi:hypothetical protein
MLAAGCGDNLAPECTSEPDCGDASCADRMCVAGRCQIQPFAIGEPAALQTPGDCKLALCDGAGHVIEQTDDGDLPTASGACFAATCNQGVPSTPPVQAGTACGTALVCDNVGQCVGCIGPIECPGTDTECHARTCTNETCGITNTTAGVKLVNGQIKGDCHVIECDGSGGTMTLVDDTDIPTTTNKCITELCNGGTPGFTYKPIHTSCGTNLECDGTGNCVGCVTASECPGSDTDCQTRTCNGGTCGFDFAPTGTPTSTQVAGDCKQQQCDGMGGTMQANFDTDTPANTPCTTGACNMGVPSNVNVNDGTACTIAGTPDNRCRTGACVPAVSLVVVGDGATALSGAAAQVSIEERFVSDGAPITTVVLPTAASGNNAACTETGVNGVNPPLEGFLTRSTNEAYVLLACYDAAPGTAAVLGTASAATNRIVARVDVAHAIDTSTRLDAAFDGNSVRSATSTDGTSLWVAGSQGAASTSGGTWYTTLGTTGGTQLEDAPTTNRCVHLFGGQLYGSSGAPTGFPDVFAIGTGLPTTAGQTATALPGMPTGMAATNNPLDYVMLDLNPNVAGLDTLYVADNRAAAAGGGIQKWTFDGATWTLVATFDGLTPGIYALTGYALGTTAVLVAVSSAGTANVVVTYSDDGMTTPAPTTIATAGASVGYRGVALAPH